MCLDCRGGLYRPARIELDDAVLERLDIEASLDYIRKNLCAEPSVNGGRMPDGLRKDML